MANFSLSLKRTPVALFIGDRLVATTKRIGNAHAAGKVSSQPPLPGKEILETSASETPAPARLPGISDRKADDLLDLLEKVSGDLEELQKQHRQSLDELQQVAVELAISAASWLTGTAIDRGHFAVDDLIRMAIHRLEADTPVRVRLNPQDHELLKILMSESKDQELVSQFVAVDDPQQQRGSIRVESGRRTLLSDMETRLEEIRRTWMENLDVAQIERRADGTGSRTLRRFPERRETA
ncbi:MAG: FliH/SctL family protein [Planctomyces sp.]